MGFLCSFSSIPSFRSSFGRCDDDEDCAFFFFPSAFSVLDCGATVELCQCVSGNAPGASLHITHTHIPMTFFNFISIARIKYISAAMNCDCTKEFSALLLRSHFGVALALNRQSFHVRTYNRQQVQPAPQRQRPSRTNCYFRPRRLLGQAQEAQSHFKFEILCGIESCLDFGGPDVSRCCFYLPIIMCTRN